MSNNTAIGDISKTLINLLWDNLDQDRNSIKLISPGDIKGDDDEDGGVHLSLFLYQVVENVHMKNQEMEMVDTTIHRYAPLTLDLYYILTVYPIGKHKTDMTIEQHKLLGQAMQVFYDNTIITGSTLQGSLEPNDEFHIILSPMNIDDITKIWSTFQEKSFRISVCYLVTPVMIDSIRKVRSERVVSKKDDYDQMMPKEEEE